MGKNDLSQRNLWYEARRWCTVLRAMSGLLPAHNITLHTSDIDHAGLGDDVLTHDGALVRVLLGRASNGH